MKNQPKVLDTFQIAGFIISVVISIGLLISKQDTISSVILGLVLATLTQLIDIQIRSSESEGRLLQANFLNQKLYHDEWLLKHIQEIVDNYLTVKGDWLELFKRRADDAVAECRSVLHSMAEGYLITEPRGPYSFGAKGIDDVVKSYKHVAANTDLEYWQTTYAEKGLQANTNAVKRGVVITRVFVQKTDSLRRIITTLEKQKNAGIQVYVANIDELPEYLCEDYVITDDRAYAIMELSIDGHYTKQRISIEPVEVEKMVRQFEMLLHHSKKLEDVLESLKKTENK